MIPWLAAGQPFPDVDAALRAPNGLLAASSELSTERLLAAYAQGIFPWYSDGEPVLWWSPDPRMVLYCAEFRVSRSLQRSVRRAAHSSTIEICIDRAFTDVMLACAAPRSDVLWRIDVCPRPGRFEDRTSRAGTSPASGAGAGDRLPAAHEASGLAWRT